MAKLILQFKGANIKEFLLEKTAITIGRDPKNDIVIDNLAVSRFHTKITQQGNNYFVEDLQSGNGTFLNEQRVDKEILKHNDAITVGKHTLVFIMTVSSLPDTFLATNYRYKKQQELVSPH